MATASVPSRSTTASRPENLDTMLPGPASRNNNGCCACSLSGLLVYGAGSGAVVVDPRSMQLVSVLPMPSPFTSSSSGAGSVAPFVTAVRWSLHTLPRDLVGSEEEVLANLHFRLAVGDRQGRIAIWDFRSKQIVLWLESDDRSKLAIQDLCWFRSDTWILASISGPSLLSLWDISTGRCFWKYDCLPELFSCIRRDPFDPHHFCVLGLCGGSGSATCRRLPLDDEIAGDDRGIPAITGATAGGKERSFP